ncbi:Suppressor of fused protein [Tenacibaculum litopenaei]|uniref:suppressor of fused domain protein n=1 Tax=Tenacibaculum litopenaei TaxID=396016 RepID=UPI0038937A04
MNLVNHLERNLGLIDKGWNPNHNYQGVQCVGFKDEPYEELYTYSTLGLSDFLLEKDGKKYRFELLLSVEQSCKSDEIASFLINFGEYLIEKQEVLLRGEVKSFENSIFTKSKFYGVYISIPVFFDDDFHIYKVDENNTVIFVSLIPLYKSEIEFIKNNGWELFEDLLEEEDMADFWSFQREEWQLR